MALASEDGDGKLSKGIMKNPRWGYQRVALAWMRIRALLFKGDYVSTRQGVAGGVVVASRLSATQAALGALFLQTFPPVWFIGGFAATWFSCALVACFGAVLHAGAAIAGVGYAFCPDLSLVSLVAGIILAGCHNVLWRPGFSLVGVPLAALLALSTGFAALVAYREVIFIVEKHVRENGSITRQNMWRPLLRFREQVIDILASPPIGGRRRGEVTAAQR